MIHIYACNNKRWGTPHADIGWAQLWCAVHTCGPGEPCSPWLPFPPGLPGIPFIPFSPGGPGEPGSPWGPGGPTLCPEQSTYSRDTARGSWHLQAVSATLNTPNTQLSLYAHNTQNTQYDRMPSAHQIHSMTVCTQHTKYNGRNSRIWEAHLQSFITSDGSLLTYDLQ